MGLFSDQKEMLRQVAEALGPDLRRHVAFVGGCTTGLLLTDPFTREQVRSTGDVDLIVSVLSRVHFYKLKEALNKRGFREPSPLDQDMPICSMKLGQVRVDLMPDEEGVLGFSNRWYRQALQSAELHHLCDGLTIYVVTPPCFLATKLEAYRGRGNGDPMMSQDIEDVLNLVDGRPEVVEEMKRVDFALQDYIASELADLLRDDAFGYAVQSQAKGDEDRENELCRRLELLAGRGS